MLRLYYIDLIELASALIFLVVFKIVLLYGMNKMAAFLADDPGPNLPKPKRRLPSRLDHLRLGMAVVLTLNGLWQIRPVMLSLSQEQLIAAGSSSAAAHWWLAHASWLNIWSVLIDLCFAAVLFSFAHPVYVRIFSGMFSAYSLVVWIWLDGFHHLIGPAPSFLAGSPGTALLLCLVSIPLVLQFNDMSHWFEHAMAAFWCLLCIVQWLPEGHFWSGQGYRAMANVHPAHLPFGLQSLDGSVLGWLAGQGVAGTLMIGLVALALAALWYLNKAKWVGGVAFAFLTVLWLVFEGAGFGGTYAFPLGSAPALALWVFYARVAGNGKAASFVLSSTAAVDA